MKVRFNHWYKTVLVTLLSMLGFASCNVDDYDENDPGGLVLMYGVPSTTYQINGNVTDEAGKSIDGISVKLVLAGTDQQFWTLDSVGTKSGGKFSVKDFQDGDKIPSPSRLLILTDVDGAAKCGEFKTDTLQLSDLQMMKTKSGSGNYDLGEYSLVKKIQLKKK